MNGIQWFSRKSLRVATARMLALSCLLQGFLTHTIQIVDSQQQRHDRALGHEGIVNHIMPDYCVNDLDDMLVLMRSVAFLVEHECEAPTLFTLLTLVDQGNTTLSHALLLEVIEQDIPRILEKYHTKISDDTELHTLIENFNKAHLFVIADDSIEMQDDMVDLEYATRNNKLKILGNLIVRRAAEIGALYVDRNATVAGDLRAYGDFSVNGDTFLSDVILGGTTTALGNFVVNGGIVLNNGTLPLRTLQLLEDPSNGTDFISLQAPASLPASYSFVFPPNTGIAGQVLTTDSLGDTFWAPAGGGGAGDINNGGNVVGGTMVVGTINNFGLNFITNSISRIQISNSGIVSLPGLNSVGVVHTDNFGDLSTSLIVNNDIANSTITDSKLATISTIGKVANSATSAMSANIANTIVSRDALGNFAAGTITANLTGASSLNVLKSGDTMTGNLVMDNQTQLRLREQTVNGINYIALRAPVTVTTDTVLTLPDGAGSANQVLTSLDGTGTLAWQSATALPGAVINGGNTVASTMTIGTLNNFGLNLITNNLPRVQISNTGVVTLPNLAGTGDRVVQADALGDLSALLPTGIQNIVQVIKNVPLVVGKFYPDIKSAVDWANANAVVPTAIVVAAGQYSISNTIAVTNTFLAAIVGTDPAAIQLIPSAGLIGSPLFVLAAPLSGQAFSMRNMHIDGTATSGWQTTPGSVGLLVSGDIILFLNDFFITNCYRALQATGGSGIGAQTVVANGIFFVNSGDSALLADNGAVVLLTDAIFSGAINQLILAQQTNPMVSITSVISSGGFLSNSAQGVLVKDTATAQISTTRATSLQNVFTVQDSGILQCANNIIVAGSITDYRQLSSSAKLIVANDIVAAANDTSKYVITNSANVLFNIINADDGENLIGNFADTNSSIFAILNNHGMNDPRLAFKQNWFGTRGLVYETPLASLSGVFGAMDIASAIDSNVMVGALVRGASAASHVPSLTLATYASTGDPTFPDLSLLRRWTIGKEATTDNLKTSFWNGATETTRFTLTPLGNVGIGTATPSSALEVGSGQIAAPAGSSTNPSYSTIGDLNTGIYFPAANTLGFSTGGVQRLTLNGSGVVNIAVLASAGVVHTDVSGNLSTSLIVNNDITNLTITDSKLATITTAGKVANSATSATSANIANLIVSRDVLGNFAAGTITANLTGSSSLNVLKSGDTMIGNLVMDNQTQFRLREQTINGTNYIALQAPAVVTNDTVLTFPDGPGSANQILTTDGTGVLSWQSATALPGVVVNGGNTVASTMSIGTLNNFGLNLITNNTSRVQIANTGVVTIPNLAGAGDRVVQADALGDLSALLPTGIQNIVQVIKNSPIVVGKFYPDIKSAVDWANANAVVPTSISIAPGDHSVSQTIAVTNGNIKAIVGESVSSTRLVPTNALAGQPVFYLNQPFSLSPFYVNDFTITGLLTPGWGSTPGSIGIVMDGDSRIILDFIFLVNCYQGLYATGASGMGWQTVVVNNSFLVMNTDCGLLADNGARVSLVDSVVSESGVQQIRVQRTNGMAVETLLTMFAGQLSNEISGMGDGIFARDVSHVRVSGVRAYALQNIFTMQDDARLECTNNIDVNGTITHYRQVTPTARIIVNGDVVNGHQLSKFSIVNSANVGFNIIDGTTGERCVGSFTDQDNFLFTILTGHDAGDPFYHYENNWFGLRGLVADFPEASLTGTDGGMKAIATFNKKACEVALVRGLSAHSNDACLDLSTYQSSGDPSSPDLSLLRRWGIVKQATTHNLDMSFWDGATENIRFTLTPTGNLGLGTATPSSTLEIGSGQIAVSSGTAANPSYSHIGDLNTGIYFPVADTIGFSTVGSPRFSINGSGVVTIVGLASLGVVHTDVSGNLSTSLIVNADVDPAAAIIDTKLATISTVGKVANSATSATSANTVNAIVARDGSGNFAAGTITANLIGSSSLNVLKSGDTMSGNLVMGNQTQVQLQELTLNGLNTIGLQSPASFGPSYTLTLPTNAGSANQGLTTDGTGVLSWTTIPSTANALVNGGNTFGSAITVGTNDNFGLNLATNGIARIQISNTGTVTVPNLSTVGLVHANGAGLLTTSLIVNADVDPAAAIVDTKLATISTAGKVANSATTATSVNTANAIVARDGSGNFAAGTITANITGNLTGSSSLNVLKSGDTMTGSLVTPAGTAAAPALTFTGSTTTGLSAAIADTLVLGTTGVGRIVISPTGTITVPNLSTVGVVHNSAAGLLTTSLIVNADVDPAAAIVDTKLATISTAGKVANSATTATNVNTTNTIVARDGSGNFTAGTITANITGNVLGNLIGNVTGSSSLNVLKSGDTMSGNLVMGNQTQLQLQELTLNGLNSIGLQSPASLGASYTLTLPINPGSANQGLTTDGTGVLSWTTIPSTANALVNGGNTFGSAITVGTNDNFSLNLATNGIARIQISNTGTVTVPNLSTVGVVHNSAAGLLTTSLIVNADIDPAAAIVDTKLATISTAGKVANSATSATSANTANAIVARDGSGNFAAGTITANLTGSASLNVLKSGDTMSGNLVMGNQTQVRLQELTANGLNSIGLQSPASLGASYTLTLPINAGSANQGLTTDGTGVLSWTTIPSTANALVNGGNTFGSAITLGTNDNFSLNLATNGITRIQISNTGTVTVPNLSTVGVVHNSAAGLLTTSLIVNADVDPAAAIVDTKLATISTAGKVANSATTATSANTANAIVARDGSGNFSAGTITASLTGNVTGSASLNVLKSGDTMTGSLVIPAGTAVAPALTFTGSTTTGLSAAIADTLVFGTTGVGRIVISPTGTITVPNLSTVGVVHNSAAGLLTTSLIVNADVDPAAAIVDTKLATISTVGKVANSATSATSANTANTIVARDGSGNFSAGTITANIIGNVTGSASLNVLKSGDTMSGNLVMGNHTQLQLQELTSNGLNTIGLQSPASFGPSYTLTLPINAGSANQALTTDGTGVLSWTTIPSTATALVNGGNTFGSAITVGTNDNFGLNLATNGIARIQISNGGTVAIPNLSTVGVVHTSGAGLLTTSLIVNADVDPAAAIVDTKLATISTAGKVANSATTATSANTANAIVARDGSGNFSAGTITASLTGNVLGNLIGNVTGAASLNVLKTGDTMTGPLILSGGGANLTVGGTAGVQALNVNGNLNVTSTVNFANGVPGLAANELLVTTGTISGPNEFNSVKAAMDSIVGNSVSNQFTIRVGPGVFIEDTIAFKSFVTLIGESFISTIIRVNATSKDLFIMQPQTYIMNVRLEGATDPGKAAIVFNGGGSISIYDSQIHDSNIGINLDATVAPNSVCNIRSCVFKRDAQFVTGMKVRSSSTFPMLVSINSFGWNAVSNTVFSKFLDISGPHVQFYATGLAVGSLGVFLGGTGCEMSDGADVAFEASQFNGFSTGIHVLNVGAAPKINLIGSACRNNTSDILIDHPGATGTINGVFARGKVVINPSALISAFFIDPEVTGTVTVGARYSGDTVPQITNVSIQVQQGSNLGVISGGVLTSAGGLTVSASAGTGYLMVGAEPNDYLKYVTWGLQTLALPANMDNFLYIDNAGILQTALSRPDSLNFISLGKARTENASLAFLQEIPEDGSHVGNDLDNTLRQGLGPVYKSGSLVTKNGFLGLNVTQGNYFFGSLNFMPSGGSPISWESFYRNGSGNLNVINGVTSVDYTHYDDGTGTLAVIPAGQFARNAFYVVGDGATEQYMFVYAQTTYPTLLAAQQGTIPPEPGTWTDNIALIASIIVQNDGAGPGGDAGSIAQILDERPRLSFKASNVTAVSCHSDLSCLLNDDHPQYLLVSGLRSMSGNLNLGGNSITTIAAGTAVAPSLSFNGSPTTGFSVPSVDTLVLGTAGVNRLQISNVGVVRVQSLNSTGVVHSNATGDLSTSLIVDGDIAVGTIGNNKLQSAITTLNTPNTIVLRDGSGNFSAGTITANLIGNATTATNTVNFSGSLTGDVTGTQGATIVSLVGGQSAANVAAATVLANNSTNLNTANQIVRRDGAGNFSAGTITASLTGNVTGSSSLNVLKAGDTMSGNLVMGNQTQVRLQELTANGLNSIGLQSPALLGASYTLTLPITLGSANQGLTTDGTGVLSWTTIPSTATALVNGGNTFGSAITVGTNDNFGLTLITNSASRLVVSNTGTVTVPNLSTVGVVHTSGAGLLTTSLIVNADVDPAAAIVDTKLATILTAGKVANSATTATTANTANTIVARDGAGNFTAGTITASLTGNVTGSASLNVLKSGDTMSGNLVMGNQTQVRLQELTSNGLNSIGLQSPALLGASYTLTLPINAGSANQGLTTDGTGVLSWTTIPSTATALVNGGNTFGSVITVGTNDNFGLNLATNGITRIQISNTGTVTVPNLSTVGVVHNSAAGLLTTSLIVNADIDPAAAIVDTKLATISTAGKVANSATTATNLNTANAIVARDGSGNFNAGTITASLTGNVTGSASLNVLKSGDTMTGSLVIPAGTAAAPALTFTGSTTTGLSAAIADTLVFGTTGVGRIVISPTGTITVPNLSTVGVVHNSAAGLLTTSLIVNADVDPAAAIVDTKLATILTAGKVANSATTATNVNTANAIIARDGSGNFAAGTITANLTGNVLGNLIGNVTGAASLNVLKSGDTMLGNLVMGNQTQLQLQELTANGVNSIGLQSPALLGASYTLTLPITVGSANQGLTTDGTGVLSWTTIPSTATALVNGGNTFGSAITVGTNDNFGLNLATNGITRIQISNTGTVTVPNLSTVGVVHNSAAGLLTTSLIVNADVDPAAAIVDTKLATISTAGKVANSATTATSANTANAIVARDGAGNFSAGTITASLTGNVTGSASLNVLKSGDTMTGSLVIPAGTSAAPALTFTGSTTTGLSAAIADTLVFGTTGVGRIVISPTGTITVPNLSTVGVVHNSAAGLLTTSLIVNADVDPAAAIVDTKLATISTAGKVANSATSATNLNAINTIVARDGSGNFAAGTITASLIGNVTGAASLNVLKSGDTMSGNLVMGNQTQVRLQELTSNGVNSIGLQSPALLGASYTLTLPINAGSGNQGLTTDGTGLLSWTTIPSTANALVNGGNTFGSAITVGTNDNFGLNFITNSASRLVISNTGTVTVPSLSTVGIVHTNGVGLLTTSLIVNADIALAAAIADSKLATISTAGKVANSATTATNLNTANTIVARDGAGNFSAGTITANLVGSVTGAASLNVLKSGDTMSGNLVMGNQSQLQLQELTLNGVNSIGLQSPALLGASYTLTLPANTGSSNQVLTTDGTGILAWQAATALPGVVVIGGNTVASVLSIGTANDFGVNVITNGVNRLQISDSLGGGAVTINNLASVGIVHTNGAGLLSTSLIVNTDISPIAAIADTKLAIISTAGKVANSATTATSANTANAIVSRDGSGNFSAGTISAALVGNVTGNVTGSASLNVLKSGDTMTGNLLLNNQKQLQLGELSVNGATFVALQAPALLPSNYTLTLPTTAGSANQVLTTDGTGVLGWTSVASANTANAIVARDGSGNFSAGTITANLSGNATTATTATTATNFSGALAGDVTGSQSATVVALVGGQSAANVSAATVLANNATSANTANQIVRRNGSGNFSAGTITANLIGNVTGSASLNVLKTGDTMTGNLLLVNQQQLQLQQLTLNGTNQVNIQAPALLGASYTLTLPANTGSSNQVLTTDGTGILAWQAATVLPGVVVIGGNTVASALSIGTANDFGVNVITNGVNRLQISDSLGGGAVTINNLASVGIVHTNGAGLLSTSLIVNADISPIAAIADTKLAIISTAGKVANSATTATSANTANAIVSRDGSGNFSAGTISAALVGNVTGNVTGSASLNVLKSGDTMTGNLLLNNQKQLQLGELSANGATFVALQAPALLPSNYTLTLPTTAGSANQVLTTDGTGVLGWTTVPSTATALVNGGNSFGSLITVGANDNFGLNFITNATSRIQISNTGAVTINGLATAGVVQTNGSGLLSSSNGTNGQILIGGGTAPAWANITAGTGIVLTNGANSITLATTGATASSFPTDSGTATPALGVLTITGGVGNNISTTASGSTVTVKVSGTTNHALQVGNATGSLTSLAVATNGQIPIGSTGLDPVLGLPNTGANISWVGGAGTLTANLSGTTNNAVQIGNAGGSLTSIGVGATGQVLTGATGSAPGFAALGTNSGLAAHGVLLGEGLSPIAATAAGAVNTVLLGQGALADPVFGAVPNAALVNSSITLNNGNNITVTPNAISLGGAATVTLTGTTNNAVQVGNAGGSLTSLAVGTNGQLLIGATGASPLFATLTSTGGTVTFTAGVNSLNLETSGATANSFITDAGTATPAAGVLNVKGLAGGNISTAGAGNNLTVAVTGTTNHALQVGNATGSLASLGLGTAGQVLLSGGVTVNPVFVTPTAGTGLTLVSNATTLQYALSTPVSVANGGTGDATLTAHGVLLGEGTSAIAATAAGAVNTVLLGQGALADPLFGAVPNAALVNSSITLNNGNNITVTPNAISLGGAATVALTGTTNNAVQIGNAGGSLTSIGVGATGQVLTGATGSAPTFAALGTNSGLTARGVLLGEGLSAIAATAAGAVNTVLLGQGALADPLFGAVPNAATTGTSANMLNTLVLRDGTGSFSTQAITLSAGTAATPTLNFVGSTTAGLSAAVADTLVFSTAATNRMSISPTGVVTIPNLSTVGIVHNSAAGLLTTSLIVNADVDPAAAIVDTKLATIATAGKVLNTATTAASANTVSAIVTRDASGNFSAGTITANLTGNATTATTATSFSGSLVGDVTGTQGATVVSLVGGQTAINVAAATVLANNATSANTASQIVRRDASGNFTAGIITANLTGNVTGSASNNVLKAGDTMTGTLQHPAGTAALPSIVFTGSTTTGFSAAVADTLVLSTAGVGRISISAAGTVTIPNLSTIGIVHNSATGLLTTSLIVNADVDPAAAIVDTKLATISTVGKVANSATTATSANTANAIVARDGLGNFSAGTITANLSGNATTATTATNFSGSLVGDVTGTQGATVVSLVGGQTATNVALATVLANNATSSNTASQIVRRDVSGNFSAGAITASLTGAASLNVLKAGDTMTGSLVLPAGTAVAPSLNFTGSTTTGFSAATANVLVASTAGAARLTIDASGNTTYTSNYKANVRLGANQTITGTGTQTLQFNTTMYDLNNNFSTVTFLYTAPVAGYYFVSVNLSATYSNNNLRTLQLLRNGATITGYSTNTLGISSASASGTSYTTIIDLTAGQTLGCQLVNAGGNVVMQANTTNMAIHFMSI